MKGTDARTIGRSWFIPLKGLRLLDPHLSRDEFFTDDYCARLLDVLQGHCLFYTRFMTLNLGAYFAAAPRELVNILEEAYTAASGKRIEGQRSLSQRIPVGPLSRPRPGC